MTPFFRREGTTILINVFIILSATLYIKHKDNIIWRKALHYPTSLVPAYQAPLVDCGAAFVVSEEPYYVFLHPGITFEAHKTGIRNAAGFELDVKYVSSSGLWTWYSVEILDESTLEAIRGDVVVDLVQCEGMVQFDFGPGWDHVPLTDAEIEEMIERAEEWERSRETMVHTRIYDLG
ncbi:hypothetical protein LTR95_016534 [Oleoguttula sp. CCFEE 5521]